MTERAIPSGSVAGRKTPSFTAETVPTALQNAHHTTVWAELVVESGVVTFVGEDPPLQCRIDGPGRETIVPNQKHHVEPEPGAVFHVQFYDQPATDKTDE